MQPPIIRHPFEKTLDAFVFYRAQSFSERGLVRIKRLLPHGRAAIAGDDFKGPFGVLKTINANIDAVAIFLNEPLNAVLKLPIRFGSPFRRRIKDNRYRRRLLN